MTLEPTQAEIEAALDRSRIPDAKELMRVLESFFDGTVEESAAARLENELKIVLGDPERRVLMSDVFVGNSKKYVGQAWKELLSYRTISPTPTELAVWLAVTTKGYPPPRPYCPAPVVGVWTGTEPLRSRWRFEANGRMEIGAQRARIPNTRAFASAGGRLDRLRTSSQIGRRRGCSPTSWIAAPTWQQLLQELPRSSPHHRWRPGRCTSPTSRGSPQASKSCNGSLHDCALGFGS
jgi:hypothetical protein